jgi:energy-coupling factor transporter ATP-binding protein EcfA2
MVRSSVTFEKMFDLFVRTALEGRRRGLPRLSTPVAADDPESWWALTTVQSVSAPIGQRGAREVATLSLDSSDHAGALLVGRPGSGKSTLLHTFIRGATTMYSPGELELHLIDFKEGVEFKVYAAEALPHARTVAIESDREFGVSVLEAINEELRWRASLLRGSAEAHSSLESLRSATGDPLPRIVLVFDEFQVLFSRTDKLGSVAADALETLIRQGRGFGIHVILGSQSLAGLDALGSHVPQLLPVRILLPAAENDAFKVLGEGNTEGSSLTSAGEGILNTAAGAVEANERFRGALIDEAARRSHVAAARTKADAEGFPRRPVVFEGNAPIPAESTPAVEFADEVRGADARALRLRFGSPMSLTGTADLDLRRESGSNVLLVARDLPQAGPAGFSMPQAVAANIMLSAVARGTAVELVDFMPIEEGLEPFLVPLLDAEAVNASRRRAIPELLSRIHSQIQTRISEDDTSAPPMLLMLYGMHRARDFDPDSVDYDTEVDLPGLLGQVLRDGPEVGIHTFLWFDTVASIARRLPAGAGREASWRLAGRLSEDDSVSLIGVDAATSLREQQLVMVNEDRGVLQRCTAISQPPAEWTRELLREIQDNRKEPIG